MSVRITLKAALILAGLTAADADRDLDELIAETRLEDAARLLAERRDHRSRNIFCDGITHCANRLKEWANGGAAPAPVADGETAVLRGLLRAVESAARRGDLATVQRALADHTRDTNTRKDPRP